MPLRATRHASDLRRKALDRRFAFSGKPLVECFDEAVTYDPGAQHTAVEQDVRGRRKPGALLAQELAEVPRDGRISRIGKPDLLEAHAPPGFAACPGSTLRERTHRGGRDKDLPGSE